jgi:phage gp37-like protein
MHEFELWEDAVIAALEPLKANGLRTLEPYADQLDAEEIEEATLRFPAIYVVVGDLRIQPRNRYDEKILSVTLVVGDRNVRGSALATRGDAASPGVYNLLTLAREALHRKSLVALWPPLSCSGESVVAFAPARGICIYSASYETKTVRTPS